MATSLSAPEDAGIPGQLLLHVLDVLKSDPSLGPYAVEGSTPVVAFGDVLTAEVATLGINPSRVEFREKGEPVTPPRLATMESLGLSPGDTPGWSHAGTLLGDCRTYFLRNPYWAWFKPLDKLLEEATGASYSDGTACHLDLLPWATDPVWGKIPDASVKAALLKAGLPLLSHLLRELDLRLVLMNGKQVVDQVAESRIARIEQLGTMPYTVGGARTKLYAGSGHGVRFLGWSVNLQSTPGANSAWFRARLAEWLGRHVPELESAQADFGPAARSGASMSEEDLAAHLRSWLEATDDETVAPIGSFGGRDYLRAVIGTETVAVNADTKRAAVRELVDAIEDGSARWRVVANRRGVVNKVVFRPDGSSTPGWYAYTPTPLTEPRAL